MNLVSLFTILLFWLPISAHDAAAQYLKSVVAEAWSEPAQFYSLESISANYQIEFWQPFGVSNLNGLEIGLALLQDQTSLSFTYSLFSMPGYRSHCLAGAVGKYFHKDLFLEQELGIGIYESGNVNPAQWFVYCQTNALLRVSESVMILIKLSNWPDLFWSGSDHLPNAIVDIRIQQLINDHAFVGLGIRGAVGAASQPGIFSGYRISNQHELFAGLTLNPLGFGFGYGIQRDGLVIRFLLEAGNIFGYAPYTSISWGQ